MSLIRFLLLTILLLTILLLIAWLSIFAITTSLFKLTLTQELNNSAHITNL
jgi:hypothetical protein